MVRVISSLLAAALFVVACSSDHSTGVGTTPSHFSVVSGDRQSGVVGAQLSKPLVVRVTDDAGRPVPGTSVNFVVTSGGGSVFGGAETTNSDGEAQELWTLGTSTADSQVVQARAVNASTGQAQTFATFHATGLAGSPVTVAVFAGDSQFAAGGHVLPESIAVLVSDKYHNPTPSVTVKWQALDGSVNPTTSMTGAAGVASTRWRIHYALHTKSWLDAVVNTLAPTQFFATTLPGVASSITKIAGDGQSSIVGQDLPIAPAVLVKDSTGQPVANVTVSYYITAGSGYITGPSQVLSDSTGVATIGGWVIASGSNTMMAAIPGTQYQPVAFSAVSNGTAQAQAVVALAAFVSCELTSLASWSCWGNGTADELGSASPGTSSSRPVLLVTNQQFQSVIATELGTVCGLTAAGAAYCWGSNFGQQLGRGGAASGIAMDPMPQPVVGGLTFTSLATAGATVCGLTPGGDAYCWGSGGYGVLGNGITYPQGSPGFSPTPGKVIGGLAFSAIAGASNNVCGISAGTVYCWGDNSRAQLADTTQSGATGPVPITLPATATHIALGDSHVCALVTGGAVYCWGDNMNGQLGEGDSTTAPVSTPTLVSGGLTFASITAGGSSTCGLTSGGQAYCWGSNGFYQCEPTPFGPECSVTPIGTLGDGTGIDRTVPTAVSGGYTFATLSTAVGTTCGMTTTGTALCWGANDSGQVGNGTTTNVLSPSPIDFATLRVATRPVAPRLMRRAPVVSRRALPRRK